MTKRREILSANVLIAPPFSCLCHRVISHSLRMQRQTPAIMHSLARTCAKLLENGDRLARRYGRVLIFEFSFFPPPSPSLDQMRNTILTHEKPYCLLCFTLKMLQCAIFERKMHMAVRFRRRCANIICTFVQRAAADRRRRYGGDRDAARKLLLISVARA